MQKLPKSDRCDFPGRNYAIAFASAIVGSLILSAIAPDAQTESSIAANLPTPDRETKSLSLTDKIQAELNQAQIPINNILPEPASHPLIYETQLKQEIDYRSMRSRSSQKSQRPALSAMDWSAVVTAANQYTDRLPSLQAQLPSPNQAEPAATPPSVPEDQSEQLEGVVLTLNEIVILVLENNRDIKNAYLERIAQRQDLAVAEDKFNPNIIPAFSVNVARDENGQFYTSLGGLEASTTVSSRIPTGGIVGLTWLANRRLRDSNSQFSETNGDEYTQDIRVNFRQPLLRGAGIRVNRASIESARLTEQINVLDLRSTLIERITETILAYRELMRSQENLKNAQDSLAIARRLLDVTQALVNAGRQARVELVTSQANVANQELNLLQAQNQLASARVDLLDLLDLDENIPIVAVEATLSELPNLDFERLREIAYQNNPNYLEGNLTVQRSQYSLLEADDARRWNLDLDLSYGTNSSSLVDERNDLRAGLVMSREFGDLTLEQRFKREQVNLQQAENTLQNLQDGIELEVGDRIRDVNSTHAQVEQARRARELAAQELENEQDKLRLGGRTSITDLVRSQEQLNQARNNEIQAIIDYLNALTNLDRILGTTLETWQITVEDD